MDGSRAGGELVRAQGDAGKRFEHGCVVGEELRLPVFRELEGLAVVGRAARAVGEVQDGFGIDFEGAPPDEGFRSIGAFDGAFQRPVGAGKDSSSERTCGMSVFRNSLRQRGGAPHAPSRS